MIDATHFFNIELGGLLSTQQTHVFPIFESFIDILVIDPSISIYLSHNQKALTKGKFKHEVLFKSVKALSCLTSQSVNKL